MKKNSSQIEIKNTLAWLVLTVVVWSIIPVSMFLGRHIDTQIRNERLTIFRSLKSKR